MPKTKKVITRFAPSPTGDLHIGGLRTALYNYLYAKKENGKFLIRIEDTDQTRLVKNAKTDILHTLNQLNIKTPEEIIHQSNRINIYLDAAENLIKNDKAYYCFCTAERLDKLRADQKAKKLPPRYDRLCRNLKRWEIDKRIEAKNRYIIRLKVPESGNISFKDTVRKQVEFDLSTIDDQVLIKSDGFPTYHLASVVDDHNQEVTHVIRGEEWLPSTAKHILLYQGFDWPIPKFVHLPLMLNPDGGKLSKRHAAVSVKDYIDQGYLPEALLNFLFLQGWNPGDNREVFSLADMEKIFDLEHINKSGAIFDLQKLDWFNGEYLRKKPLGKLITLCQAQFVQKLGKSPEPELLKKIVTIEQSRLKKVSDILDHKFYFELSGYDPKILVWKKSNTNETKQKLSVLIDYITDLKTTDFTIEKLETNIMKLIEDKKLGTGDTLWPMRVALTGLEKSPGPFEMAWVLGKDETLSRLKNAVGKI